MKSKKEIQTFFIKHPKFQAGIFEKGLDFIRFDNEGNPNVWISFSILLQ